jgi:hypothetical protein
MDKQLATELYALYRAEMFENFRLHQATLQHYLTFVVAIVGATVATTVPLEEAPWLGLVVVSVPVFNSFICLIAIRLCDRYYVGMLERISIVSKLEAILGLSSPLGPTERPPFPGDRHLLPARWLELNERFRTSGDFVTTYRASGVNLLARRSFQALILINCLLIVAYFGRWIY